MSHTEGSCTHHQERVPDPEAPPGRGTRRDGPVLAVHRHRLRRGLTHGAAADIGPDLLLGQRHRGQRGSAGQPVGFVIPPGIVAHLVDVAVGKGQSAEHRKARPRQTWRKEAVVATEQPFPNLASIHTLSVLCKLPPGSCELSPDPSVPPSAVPGPAVTATGVCPHGTQDPGQKGEQM